MKAKKQLLFIAFVIMSCALFAQKVALHNPTGVKHFLGPNALQSAYAASASGDTIYLPGGSFNPPANFDRRLTIYGAGHYLDSTIATGKTFINGNIVLTETADNFYIEGVEVTGNFTLTSNHSVDNVVIKRCRINGALDVPGNLTKPSQNLALIGNVFISAIGMTNCQNVLISNNIFQSEIHGTNGNMIYNNIFIGAGGGWNSFNFTGSNNQVSNNIFLVQAGGGLTNGTGNTFRNNLMAFVPFYGGSNPAINNHTGINRAVILVNQTGNLFDYAHNYRLQNPAVYLGADSTQVGVYGGAFPYKEGAVPSNPHIESQNIAPKTSASGLLNVQIRASAQED